MSDVTMTEQPWVRQRRKLDRAVLETNDALRNWLATGHKVPDNRVQLWNETAQKYRALRPSLTNDAAVDRWSVNVYAAQDILGDVGVVLFQAVPLEASAGADAETEIPWWHIVSPGSIDSVFLRVTHYMDNLNRAIESVPNTTPPTPKSAAYAAIRPEWRSLYDEWTTWLKGEPSHYLTANGDVALKYEQRAKAVSDKLSATLAPEDRKTLPDYKGPDKVKPTPWYVFAGVGIAALAALGYLIRSVAGILPARAIPAAAASAPEETR